MHYDTSIEHSKMPDNDKYLEVSVKTNNFLSPIIVLKFPVNYAVNLRKSLGILNRNNILWEHLLVVHTVWKKKYILVSIIWSSFSWVIIWLLKISDRSMRKVLCPRICMAENFSSIYKKKYLLTLKWIKAVMLLFIIKGD